MAIDKDKVLELFARYFDLGYDDGWNRHGADSDAANDVLAELHATLDADDSEAFTAELVEIDGHTYGLRPNAAHIVKEAMADARRYRRLFDCPEPFCYRGEVFETKVVADNAIDTDMRKTP